MRFSVGSSQSLYVLRSYDTYVRLLGLGGLGRDIIGALYCEA